jgi:hypothetical protein
MRFSPGSSGAFSLTNRPRGAADRSDSVIAHVLTDIVIFSLVIALSRA